jgi:hypothetical protein
VIDELQTPKMYAGVTEENRYDCDGFLFEH